MGKRPFLTHLSLRGSDAIVLADEFSKKRERCRWFASVMVRRKHRGAWQQSTLNQREYCETHGIPIHHKIPQFLF